MHKSMRHAEPRAPLLERPPPSAGARWQRIGWVALILAGPLLLVLALLVPPLWEASWHSPTSHVLVSGAAALLGVVLSLMVLRVAERLTDGRVLLVGLGFLGIATIFFIHSIATPDVVIIGRGFASAWSAPISLVVGGMFFAASGFDLSLLSNSRLMRTTRIWLMLYFIFWVSYSATVLLLLPAQQSNPTTSVVQGQQGLGGYDMGYGAEAPHDHSAASALQPSQAPGSVPGPAPTDLARDLLNLFGAACYLVAIERHYRLYRRAPSPSGPAVLCGVILFGEALLVQYFAPIYSAIFWLYHALEFVGFGVIVVGVLKVFKRGLPGQSLFENLFLSGTRARMQSAYAAAMDELVDSLSRGQQPTPALRAVLRDSFAMSESQVHVLEHAASAIADERRQRQELERLNAELRRIEQDRDNLTQMIVHDLQNPLTALIGFLEIMRAGPLEDDQRDYLARALQSGRNLSVLIRDLLDIGQLQAGQLQLEPFQIDLGHLLADCAAETHAWAAQNGKTVNVDVQPGLPFVAADLRLLRRVVLNLISNAIKHTPSGTCITLRARQLPIGAMPPQPPAPPQDALPLLVLEVADGGPGIAPELAARIFERYVRGNNGRPDSTGLGLTFCRLAVEAHGGTIGVESAPGQGTIFRLLLPLRQIGLIADGEPFIVEASLPLDR